MFSQNVLEYGMWVILWKFHLSDNLQLMVISKMCEDDQM